MSGAERRKRRGLTGDAAAFVRLQNREEAEARATEKRRRLNADWEARQAFVERRLVARRWKDMEEEESAAATVWAAVAPLLPGEEVMLHGLRQRPQYNGLCGTLTVFDEVTSRWSMMVDALQQNCWVRECNITRSCL